MFAIDVDASRVDGQEAEEGLGDFGTAGSEEPGSPDGDPPDVVITGAAALAGLGRELAAPRATGDLLVLGSAADARAGAALGAWGMRTVPVGAERFGDAAAVRGDAA